MSKDKKMTQLQFLKAWKSSRRKELGHGELSERALSVRCHAITKSLKEKNYAAPTFPKKPTNLEAIAADLGLAKLKA